MKQKLILALLLLYVLIPILMPVIFSFSTVWQDLLPQGFTTQWYLAIIQKPKNYSALITSLIVAMGAVLTTTLISVPTAYSLNRLDTPWGEKLRNFANILPLIFPPVVVGTSLLQGFSHPPLVFTGTVFIVIIAHSLLGFPFMFRNTLAAFRTIDERVLSEAAASLGANLWQRLFFVIIPNVWPGILVGALLVFAISIGEFETTSMVAGFKAQTLPLQLFQQIRNDMRIASAISAFLVYVSLLAFIGMTFLSARLYKDSED